MATAYGSLCGVDSYEENGSRLVSILHNFLTEVGHMMRMAQLQQLQKKVVKHYTYLSILREMIR